jgi:hypothetical protein
MRSLVFVCSDIPKSHLEHLHIYRTSNYVRHEICKSLPGTDGPLKWRTYIGLLADRPTDVQRTAVVQYMQLVVTVAGNRPTAHVVR